MVDYTADLYDRQLTELLDSLRITDRVDIGGVSMGGWVTATFAGRHANRTRSLILVDPVASAATRAIADVLVAPARRAAGWRVRLSNDGRSEDGGRTGERLRQPEAISRLGRSLPTASSVSRIRPCAAVDAARAITRRSGFGVSYG